MKYHAPFEIILKLYIYIHTASKSLRTHLQLFICPISIDVVIRVNPLRLPAHIFAYTPLPFIELEDANFWTYVHAQILHTINKMIIFVIS